MILLDPRKAPIVGAAPSQDAQGSRNEQVTQALANLQNMAIEVLTANPTQSFASHVNTPEPTQALDRIYQLKAM